MTANYCIDCKFSVRAAGLPSHPDYIGRLQCFNTSVNATDACALASDPKRGRECIEERRKDEPWFFNKPACGKKGKLFKAKEAVIEDSPVGRVLK